MKHIFLISVIAALFAGAVSQASAAIVYVGYSGRVLDGYDLTGVFGTPDTDLTGARYTSVYIFDTSIGEAFNDGIENSVAGGSDIGFVTPLLSATLTIGNVSRAFGSNVYAEIYGFNDGLESEVYHETEEYTDNGVSIEFSTLLLDGIFSLTANLPSDIVSPFNYRVTPDDFPEGFFGFSTYDYTNDVDIDFAFGLLSAQFFIISDAAPDFSVFVPEPSTWAMLLTGFAGMGFTAYHGKRQRR